MTGFTIEISGPGLEEPVQINVASLEQLNDRSIEAINHVESVMKQNGASSMHDLTQYNVDVLNADGEIQLTMDLARFVIDKISEHPDGSGLITQYGILSIFDKAFSDDSVPMRDIKGVVSEQIHTRDDVSVSDIFSKVLEADFDWMEGPQSDAAEDVVREIGEAKFEWLGGPQ